MDKEEEETRELLLPNWQGSGSMGLTLDKNEEGVFVKQLVQDSPAAKTGVVKEGDQIVGATLYFDNMSSEDIERLLTNVGHHTVGLKLQRKGDRSPQPGMTWSHDVFSLKSPDVVLSGDDEEYRRIYTKKIKPRLKSDETLEPETQTRTITVTRKVTAYTVDVTGSKGTKEIDISSPEYKIKIPRHEITEISKTSIETEEGKTVIKIPSADISGRTFEMGKEISLETTGPGVLVTGGTQSISNSSVYSQVTNAGAFGPYGIHSDGNISLSSKHLTSVSGPKYQSYEQKIDVKGSSYEAAQRGHIRGPQDSETSSIDIQMKGSILKGAEADSAGKSAINTDFASMDSTFGISGFQSSTIMLKETRFDMQKPGGLTVEQSDINVKVPQTSESNLSLSAVCRSELSGDQIVKDYPESCRGTSVHSTVRTTEIFLPGQRKDTSDGDVYMVAPILDVKHSQKDIDSAEVKNQIPSFKVSGMKKVTGDTDLKLQETATSIYAASPDTLAANLQINGKNQSAGIKLKDSNVDMSSLKAEAPDVAVLNPKIDVQDLKGEVKGPTFKMSSKNVNLPKVPMTDLNLYMKGSKAKEVDISIPTLEGGLKGPQIEIESSVPGVELEGPEGTQKMPKFKMPKFGFSGSKVDGKDVDIKLPEVEIDVSGPKVDISAPNLDIEYQEGKVKGSKFTMPDKDFNVKSSELEGDLKGPKADIKTPEVNLEAPDVDIDGKVKGSKFKMPSIPKVSMPDVGLNVKGPKLEGELKGPKIDMKGPQVNVEVSDVELEGPEGKLKMPKFKMPKFGFSGSKVDGKDVDIKLPEGEIDVSGPKVDIGAPELDIQCPEGKVKDPKFKMPSLHMPDIDFNLKGPKMEGDLKGPKVDIKAPEVNLEAPDVDVDGKVKGPKFNMPSLHMPNIDLNLKGPKMEGDLKGPKVDIKAPEVNLEAPDVDFDGKVKGPKFKMPSMPKVSMPDVGLNVKGPKLEGDLKGPKIDMKGPEVDVAVPDVELEGPEGKLKMPKFKMPKFGIPGSNVDVKDVDIKLPKGEIDVSVPKMDIGAPELDFQCPEGKVKGSKFKMPSLHMPDIDFNLKGPKLEGDLKGPKVDMKAPEVNLEAPDVDFDGKVKGPKFKMPSMPKVSMSDVGLNVKGPKVEGELKGPKIDMKGPEVDVAIPDVELEGPEGKLKMPKFKMPKFGFSGSKVDGKDVDIELPEADLSASGPKVDISAPKFNIKGLEGKVKGPKVEMPSVNLATHDVHLNLKGPKLEGQGIDPKGPEGNIDIAIPKTGLDIKAPDVSLPSTGLDIEGPEGNFKMPKVKKPKFGFGMKSPKADINVPAVDIGTPDVEVNAEMPEIGVAGKGKKGKLKMPKIHMSGPKIKGKKGGFDVNTPELDSEVSMKTPNADISISGGDATIKSDIGIKGTKTRKPLFGKIHFPDVEFDIKSPKLKGDASLPSPKADIKTSDLHIGGEINTQEVEVSSTGLDIGELDVKSKKSKIKLPAFSMSGAKVEYGHDTSLPKDSINVSGLKLEGDIKASGTDASLRKLDADLSSSSFGGDLSLEGPKIQMPSVSILDPNVSFPDSDLNVTGPKIGCGLRVASDFTNSDASGSLLHGDAAGLKFNMGKPDINLKGQDLSLKGNLEGQFKGPQSIDVAGAKVGGLVQGGVDGHFGASGISADTESSAVKISFPRLLMPKFTGPEHLGREMGVDVDFPKVETTNLSQADHELEEGDIKIKKSKIKMPKFNFSKAKGKGEYNLPDVSVSGSKGDLKSSKASLGSAEGAVGSAGMEVVSERVISSREKSPKYEFSLFTSKKPRHRSSSMSEEIEGAMQSSPSGTLELDSGGMSLEGGKKKGKHSKIKFGTFGGLGSKSKGSYEVTLSDDENVQGSGASLSSRKSRVSSSSSNDSGTKAGVKLPKVELTVAKKKQ